MAALADEVTSRLPTQVLAELTSGTPGATTVDTAKLALAVADATAAMEVHACVTYDGTNSRHVAYGVRGVLLFLASYKGEDKAVWERLKAWEDSLFALRKVERHDRIIPKSSSRLTPTEEAPGATIERPLTDPETFWRDVLPAQQPAASRRGGFPPSGTP